MTQGALSLPETHSAPLAAELAPAPALETSTVAEPRVDSALGSAACSSADQRVTEGQIVGRPESVEVVTNTYFSGEQRAAIIHKFIYKMRLYLCMPHFHALSSWKCECRVLREVSTPVLLMQMSLAMGQRKVLLHQWCRLQRIKVLG